MENKNLIKDICKKYNLTYKQLADIIGYSESAIKNASANGASHPMKKSDWFIRRNIDFEKRAQKIK